MSAGAYEDDGDAIIEMDLLPPRWIDVQDEVNEILTDLTLKSAKLDKLHQKHVLPGFDDEHIKQQEEREIEKLTQEITRGFHECQRAIKRIEKMVEEAQLAGSLSRGDEAMAKNIQIALAARIQEVSTSFRKKQTIYLNSKTASNLLCTRKLIFGRNACPGRLRVTVSTCFHSSAEPLLGSRPPRIGGRQILFAINASADCTKALSKQRCNYSPARA